jgi:hypothetical protein
MIFDRPIGRTGSCTRLGKQQIRSLYYHSTCPIPVHASDKGLPSAGCPPRYKRASGPLSHLCSFILSCAEVFRFKIYKNRSLLESVVSIIRERKVARAVSRGEIQPASSDRSLGFSLPHLLAFAGNNSSQEFFVNWFFFGHELYGVLFGWFILCVVPLGSLRLTNWLVKSRVRVRTSCLPLVTFGLYWF